MGLEQLAALIEAAQKETEQETRERSQLPALEAHTCTLADGSRVLFDVPHTRKR